MRGLRRPPLAPRNNGVSGAQWIGTQRDVARDGIARHGQHRNQPLLAALAHDTQDLALCGGGILALDPQRFRDAQAGPVEQQQHRRIARGDPVEFGNRSTVDDSSSLFDGQRLGDAMRYLRQRNLQNGAVPGDLFRFQPAKEGPQGRHAAGQRPARKPGPAPRRHEGAEALGIQAGEIGQARRMAQRSLEPDQKLAQVALVSLECLVRLAALVREMREPRP